MHKCFGSRLNVGTYGINFIEEHNLISTEKISKDQTVILKLVFTQLL